MQKIQIWFKDHSASTHMIAATLFFMAGLIKENEQVRSTVLAIFIHHPSIGPIIMSTASILLLYKGAHSAQGILAEVPKALDQIKKDPANVIPEQVITSIVAAASK